MRAAGRSRLQRVSLRLIPLLAAAAVAGAAWRVRTIHIDTDLGALVAKDSPAGRALLDSNRAFGREELLVVLLEGQDPALVAAGADRLAARLSAEPAVRCATARLGPRALEYVRRFRFVLLDEADWQELERRAADPKTAERWRSLLGSPVGMVAQARLADDPLDTGGLLGRRLGAGAPIDPRSGLFAAAGGRAALVLVEGAKPVSDRQAAEALLRLVGAHAAGLGLAVSSTGAPAYRVAYERAIRSDLARSSVVSFAAILLLFGFFFRSLRVAPFVGLGLAVTYVVTLGAWSFGSGRIGALALAFGGILLGIAVDVPIQLFARLRETLADLPPERAVWRATREIAPVAVVATLGPALVFAACGFSRFAGLAQLGWIAALGLVVNLPVMLLVLPSLLALTGSFWAALPPSARGERLLERLGAACGRRRRMVLVGAAVLALPAALLFGRVRLADHPLASDASLEPARVEARIEQLFGPRRGALIALDEGETIEQALEGAWRAAQTARSVGPAQVRTVVDLLPPATVQSERLLRLRSRRDALERRLRETLAGAGIRPEACAPFFASLGREERASFTALDEAGFSPLVRSLLGRSGPRFFAAMHVQPRGPQQVAELAAALSRAGARVTGLPELERELSAHLPLELSRLMVASVLGVILLLVLFYRRLRPVVATLIPLAWAWALFAALAPALSVWNLLAVPLVVGYGIDDHVFILSRALEPGCSAPQALRLTGRAVVATSLATLFGFLSLCGTSFAGLRSLGWAGALAVGLCFLAAMTVLPALLAWVRREGA